VNCWVLAVKTEAVLGAMDSVRAVPDVMVTTALETWVVSATDVAVTVTVGLLGITAGAV
jgi:hypothetical protein